MTNRTWNTAQWRWALLGVLLTLALATQAMAQHGGGGGGGKGGGGEGADSSAAIMPFIELQLPKVNSADRDLKPLDKAATLTTEQKTQVTAILTARNQQIEALLAEFKEAAKVAANRKKAEGAAAGQAGGHGGGQGGQPGMPSDLERQLANAARFKLNGIRQEAQQKTVALLSDLQKKSYSDWQAKQGQEQLKKEALDFQYVFVQPNGDVAPLGEGRGGGGR